MDPFIDKSFLLTGITNMHLAVMWSHIEPVTFGGILG